MPLIALDASDPNAPRRAAEAVAALPAGMPVVAMIHGYRYAPGIAGHCPRESLYSEDGWPGQLGLGDALLIGFGWNARGTIWQARAAASRAGGALAQVMRAVHATGRPVDSLGHSLGARVALTAAGLAPPGAAGRLVLLAAAAFRGEASAVLSTPGGQAAEIFNVISHENDVFDALLGAAFRDRHGRALGAGLGEWRRNWLDLRIDSAEVRAALGLLGFAVPAAARRFCHWSGYLRPGLIPFYAALFRDRAILPMPLIASLLPDLAEPAPAPARLRRAWIGRRAV